MYALSIYIYIYLRDIKIDLVAFSSSSSMWWDSFAQGAQVASYLLHSASCPLYCGGSGWPWFLAGLSVGLLVGLCAAGFAVWVWVVRAPVWVANCPQPSSVPQHPQHIRRRLSAYIA